jgi:acyl carrier protein
MDNKFKQLISEGLELDISEVTESLILDPEENWDSLALLSIISEIDTQYGIQLDGEKLASCRTISEIYNLIKDH